MGFGDLRRWNEVEWKRGLVERLSGYPGHVTESEFKDKTSAAIQN